MNILVDENVARQVVERLRQDGHNVNYTIQGQSISDDVVLDAAYRQRALLVTDDKDFGELIIRQRQQASGVILVRLSGLSPVQKAEVVSEVIRERGDNLLHAFTVITLNNVRSRPLE
jgi:predicted nuclease of predicted toxin-antitoxin system